MQKTAVIVACWLTCLSPLAAHAVDVDYPDLGVKLTNLPASAKAGRVGESLQGYSVQILFGDETTSADIYRFDEAVPEGNIADKSYRKTLNKQLGVPEAGAPINKPVTIAGQSGWMTGFAQGFGPMAVYRCSFYLVVGQHLYRIAVSATGKKQAAASSFNAAAQAIASGLVFEPVERQPDKPLAPGELPPFLMGRQVGPFYPDRARRIGEAGIVMLKFNIDGRGAIQDVRAGPEANADLAQAAESMLQNGRFKVPQGWEQSGGSKQSFTMEFRYYLSCPPDHPLPDLVPGAQGETICGSVLPH